MSTKILVVPTNIEELVAQILMYRRVTRTEQLILKYTLLYKEELNEQEKTLIDRIFYGVRHGLLKLVE